MRRLANKEFDRPWLLLCEGETDRLFFNELISDMGGFEGRFAVQFPGKDNKDSGGRSKFGTWLANIIETSASFNACVKAVLIASDSDLDHDKSFSEVLDALRPHNKIAQPSVPEMLARQSGHPDVFVMMIPRNRPGCLETYCVSSAYSKWPNIRQPIEDLLSQSDAIGWSRTKQDKMRIQCVISCTCEANPEGGLRGHWYADKKYHIPIHDPAFQEIRDTISSFAAKAST